MSVLDRASLEQSPLADLHAIASELSIDGYRRLRKPELIDAILARQGGGAGEEATEESLPSLRRRRGRRGGRGRGGTREEPETHEEESPESAESSAVAAEPEEAARPEGPEEIEEELREGADEIIEGVVDLLPNGSGFARVRPPEPSDDDVYISAAQVKRCELVSGDRVSGPRRAPRRSERFASLLRIDMINGRPAADMVGAARFEELPLVFPSERFAFEPDDPTVAAIESLAPIGRGSRVTIVGGPQTGKTEALRALAAQLSRDSTLQLWLVLTGTRPEEEAEWQAGPVGPAATASLGASADTQGQAVEGVVEQARRMAARGADAVVLIDTLDGLPPHVAARALGSARNLVEAGSLTVIATASQPHGGETTVVALDAAHARAGRFPAIDHEASWTMRAELLVGESGAEAISRARFESPQ